MRQLHWHLYSVGSFLLHSDHSGNASDGMLLEYSRSGQLHQRLSRRGLSGPERRTGLVSMSIWQQGLQITILPPALPPARMIRSGLIFRSAESFFACSKSATHQPSTETAHPKKNVKAIIDGVRIFILRCHPIVDTENHSTTFRSQISVLDLLDLMAANDPT